MVTPTSEQARRFYPEVTNSLYVTVNRTDTPLVSNSFVLSFQLLVMLIRVIHIHRHTHMYVCMGEPLVFSINLNLVTLDPQIWYVL